MLGGRGPQAQSADHHFVDEGIARVGVAGATEDVFQLFRAQGVFGLAGRRQTAPTEEAIGRAVEQPDERKGQPVKPGEPRHRRVHPLQEGRRRPPKRAHVSRKTHQDRLRQDTVKDVHAADARHPEARLGEVAAEFPVRERLARDVSPDAKVPHRAGRPRPRPLFRVVQEHVQFPFAVDLESHEPPGCEDPGPLAEDLPVGVVDVGDHVAVREDPVR